MPGYYATAKKKRTIIYWFRALASTITTTVLYFLLSYSVFLNATAVLLSLLLANLVVSIIFIYSAITKSISRNRKPPQWIMLLLVTIILSIPLNYCYMNGLFFGAKTLEASFVDEFRTIDLVLYKSEHYIVFTKKWTFGAETYIGHYSMHGDTIVFEKTPINGKRLISKKILRVGNKIYFNQKDSGDFNRTFYFFQIEEKKLAPKRK